jgi:RHS repeat-associated protein
MKEQDAMRVQFQNGGQSVTHGSGPSSSPTVSTTTNRITALGGSNYYYDANGSLTQDDLFKYKYDAENRVVEIRNLSDTLLTSYAYDGHSMQVIKVAGGTRTWFLYAGGKLVSEYYDAAANNYSSPTSPASAPSDSQSTLLYQHADHLTTRVTTDNAGTLSNQQAHYPYGENWYANGAADGSVQRKFTSYRKEGGSLASGQINYAIARYHGARIGRFHRPDPVRGNFRNPQRLNRYAYVTNNPVRYIDPKGLDMSDGIGPEWQCPQGPGNCIVPVGGGLIVNPNSYGGMHPFNAEAYANYVERIGGDYGMLGPMSGSGAGGGGGGTSGFGLGEVDIPYSSPPWSMSQI